MHKQTFSLTHTALWVARVVPTQCSLSRLGRLGMHQLISSLSVWPNHERLMKVSLMGLLMCICDCLRVCEHVCVCGETRIVENCVKRFLHNKHKLRLTPNSLPSAAYKSYAGDHPFNSNLLNYSVKCCISPTN